ncbi:MAG: threonine--tRNA ligase [Candidatus Dojkabacteria bacterium]
MKSNETQNNLWKLRHTCEHVFNQAIEELFPGKIVRAMGPAIEDGWYNDSRWDVDISENDFSKIEKRMQKIIDANFPLIYKEVSEQEAREMFKDNPFKQEFIDEFLKDGKKLSVYYTGDPDAEPGSYKKKVAGIAAAHLPGDAVFVDLCAGPHVKTTGEIKAFKLLSIAGAYWRGDEKNEMLTRVYGTAFESKEELDEYLHRLEEAKKRDHRKIAKDQDLIVFSDLVGKGLPLWTPRGATIRRELERFVVDEEIKRGYLHVYTPDIANLDLYRTSGHYPYYKDSMYAPITIDNEEFMLRPMTCPHHFQLYQSRPRSYKELPMRIAELAKLYRYEKSGELTGLIRVRSFCLADAHIITPKEKAEQEIESALSLIEYACEVFGLKANEDYSYRLSLGDRKNEKKYYKDDQAWDYAENVLRNVLKRRDVNSYEAEDEAAFYGPKIDIQMRNVNGKEDTAFTVQYDFVMPKRFKLSYIDEDGSEKEPVVVHRSSIGAIERSIAFLIERYSGAFPVWLHPEQVAILPVSEKHADYAVELEKLFKQNNLRTFVPDVDQTLGNKIRKAQELKIPYMIIIGDQEMQNNTVNVRLRNGETIGEMSAEEFIKRAVEKIKTKSLAL